MPNYKDKVNFQNGNKDKKFSRVYPATDGDDVVISGMAGKFPNCHNIDEYEYKLYNKIDMIDDDERRWRHFHPEIPKRSGKIYDLEKFDATFFGVHFKQSHTMDPQTRMLIEIAYEAVIDAGVNPKSLRGTRTGVYIGACVSESEKTWFYEKVSSGGFGITGCSRAMLPNRISYSLGLEGPSFLLDTACSSSMYALDNAFTAFRNGEIDAAIIGGSNLCLHPFVTLQFARLGVLAPDGYCRPFDQHASGYTRSETISCLFLQRKRDANRVYASIVYSKTNCDGYKPEGITYPSGKLQEKLLREFYQEIDVCPEELGYLEAHSTGTRAGDPEECRAIDNVLCSQRSTPLLVGSVKSNIGHAEPASGVSSLAKACFAFETGKIAPNINFTEIKSEIPALAEGRLIVVKDTTNLEKPYIGVSSFGFGGANAHALLKAFDKIKINHGVPDDDIPRLITWAGRTEESVNVVLDAIEGKPLDAEFISLLHNIQNEDVTGLVFRGYGIFAKDGNTSAKCLARQVDHYSGIKRPIVWDWFVTKYENMKTKSKGERSYTVNLGSDDEEFLSGHVIDGKILIPAICYLRYVWETFSLMYHGPSYMDVPVEFEEVKFLRATSISTNGSVELNVMIHYGTGNFEITESGALVVTGRITEIERPSLPEVYDFIEESVFPTLCQKDFYKELRLRGYHYKGSFRAVKEARGDGLQGKVGWNLNWVTFIDAMLQIQILGTDSRTLLLPTNMRKLRICGLHHVDLATKMDPENRVFEVYVDRKHNRIVSGGIEIVGLHASPVQRRKSPGIPILERYQFVSHFPAPAVSIQDAVRICVQLALENSTMLNIKTVEVDTDGRLPIIENFVEAIEDLPLITGDYVFLSNQVLEDIPKVVHVEDAKLLTQKNCHFIIISALCGELNELVLTQASKSLVERGYLVVRINNSSGKINLKIPDDFKMVADLPIENTDEIILLLQCRGSKKFSLEPTVVEISGSDKEFTWLIQLKQSVNNKTPTVVYAYNEKLNGLIGLVNCLRKEPDGQLITCFFINDKSAPAFNINAPFYAAQYALGLAVNVYQNGKWGSYRHLLLNSDIQIAPRKNHVYGNVLQRGDLSSLRWFEGPLKPEDCDIKIAYSSVNFRDIMLATGRLAVELYGDSRLDQSCVLGFEYSGIHMKTGHRIMSMVVKGGVGSYVEKPSRLIWDVPDNWSLKDAATVPVVYITVYYAFFMISDIHKGKSILIHAGTGGIGLAAIRVALAYNLEVFTTCSTSQKKQFLLETFPQLKGMQELLCVLSTNIYRFSIFRETENHIGNSRDTSFERMIIRETEGKGVDFVLNSLSEDKLLASVRCLGITGHFLEIGKFDMANDTKLGMSCFLKEIKFNAVLADRLLIASDEEVAHLKALIDNDIANGIIQPLPATVFQAHEIEQAFRHMVGGKHMGKVVIQVREDPEAEFTMPVKVVKQVYFDPNLSFVIPGGLGGFGLELADWMALRGARKLILSSSRGLMNDYQRYRIALWKTYGCEVFISTSNICTYEGCRNLLKEANNIAPIGGIFNLAVTLQDAIFVNQTKEKFVKSFEPKAIATKYLDELSRVMCPRLKHFVVFSSVSCGRGNAGQTNYGMANSVMERIIEDRIQSGFPAKAIQWGAVGEVGLVADMVEDKIDIDIGGTLQQRISSCLQELDTLLSAPDAIVASMVVAEKRLGSSDSASIIETVMNIMGIRDIKSVSLGTTLSEMGMDSLMAIEIKQTLERNFDLALTPQDLRALTFQKLQEYEDARQRENNETAKMIFASEDNNQGIKLLLRNLGDETRCNEVMIELQSTPDTLQLATLPTIMIPGIEGTAGQVWYKMAKNINSKVNMLQFHRFAELTSIKEIAEACYEDVKTVLKANRQFYIVAYSYGAFIALELVAMLEKAGFDGQLLLIDGAPHFLTKLTHLHLPEHITDNDLYDLLLSIIVREIFPEDIKELLEQQFSELPTIEQKMEKFDEHIAKQNVYTSDYSKAMIHAMFRRISSVIAYDVKNFEPINTPITLIRPTEVALQDIDENYCLHETTKGPVVVKVIEGSHTSMLDNPLLPRLINDFNPSLMDLKDFEKTLK
uniref:Fatty acid synthase n=1 Tax=Glossina palpalis gambiensis TaxID=67801 RepID=A0A1B0B9K0_9MUSC